MMAYDVEPPSQYLVKYQHTVEECKGKFFLPSGDMLVDTLKRGVTCPHCGEKGDIVRRGLAELDRRQSLVNPK